MVQAATRAAVIQAVARAVVPAVARAVDRVTAEQVMAQVMAEQVVARAATPHMLQPDRLIVAVIMEPLEVEWPAMVQAVVMVSV